MIHPVHRRGYGPGPLPGRGVGRSDPAHVRLAGGASL